MDKVQCSLNHSLEKGLLEQVWRTGIIIVLAIVGRSGRSACLE